MNSSRRCVGETPSKIVAPVGQTVILREWAVLYRTVNLGGTTEAAFRPFADERFFVSCLRIQKYKLRDMAIETLGLQKAASIETA